MEKGMNKVTLYRLGCIKICDMYVDKLRQECVERCPKLTHPYEGMEEHIGRQEQELFCENVVECAKCTERHFEGLKDHILAQYDIRRTWRDKQG